MHKCVVFVFSVYFVFQYNNFLVFISLHRITFGDAIKSCLCWLFHISVTFFVHYFVLMFFSRVVCTAATTTK